MSLIRLHSGTSITGQQELLHSGSQPPDKSPTFFKVLPAFVAQDAKGLLCIFSDPAQTAYISRKGLLSVEELHPETTPGDELCSALLGSLALGL